jgi:hypothetical protein
MYWKGYGGKRVSPDLRLHPEIWVDVLSTTTKNLCILGPQLRYEPDTFISKALRLELGLTHVKGYY